MKRLSVVLIALFMVLAIFASLAMAEDAILNTKIDSVVTAKDKNDNTYIRFIITESRTLDGVAYQKTIPVMAFGNMVAPAKAYKAGDMLKAVASYRKLPDGRESYSILAFAK